MNFIGLHEKKYWVLRDGKTRPTIFHGARNKRRNKFEFCEMEKLIH